MNGFVITNFTPHLLVDATQPNTLVPEQFIQDGQIVLNIVPHAVHALHMSNEAITFSARFGGVSRDLYVPMNAVLGYLCTRKWTRLIL